MPYVAKPAYPSSIVDASVKLAPRIIERVAAAGYAGIARYVPLPNDSPAQDIDAIELASILDAGLAILLVQHVRSPPWNPAHHAGDTDAHAAIEFARTAGYLPGAHIFLDLEGITGTGPQTKLFAEAWAEVVVDAGYLAGCYVGYAVPLTAQELYELHRITSYWSDPGPRQVATRGFAMKQQVQIRIGGVAFDPDTIEPDALGETPVWMVSSQEEDAADIA